MHIAVIGAGIAGLCSAYALHRAGHTVTLIDRNPGPALGCSQANGGFLSPVHCVPWGTPSLPKQALAQLFDPEAPMRWRPQASLAQMRWLLALLRESTALRAQRNRQRMRALADYSRQCQDAADAHLKLPYDRQQRGTMLLCRAEQSVTPLHQQAQNLQRQGLRAHWLAPDALFTHEPGLHRSLPQLFGGLWVQGEGSGQCEAFCAQLQPWLAKQGVRFLWRSTVQAVELAAHTTPADPRPVQRFQGLRIDGQSLPFDACVVATGPDAARLLAPQMHVPVYPVKGYSMTARLRQPALAPRHAVLDEHSKLAIAPFADTVRVAGFADVVGHDLQLDPRRCQQLAERFEALYPGVADTAQAEFWCGLRPMTPDGTPIVGATPVPGLYLNTGHGTYGWTLAFGSAALLSDVINQRPTALPSVDYALARFGG